MWPEPTFTALEPPFSVLGEGYVFNMKKATRSTYHNQIKYIERNEDMIRKDRFSNELLSKDMSQFWRSVTDLRGKSKRTSNIIDDFSYDNDVSECFARSYDFLKSSGF